MPFVPVPNVVRIVIKGTQDTTTWANVLHMSYTGGPPSATTLSNAAANIYTGYANHFTVYLTQNKALEEVEVIDINSDTGASGLHQLHTPGTMGTNHAPASSAVVISKQIARHYRGGHGRVYLPVGDSTVIASSLVWQTTFVQNIQTAWLTFMGGIVSGGAWAGAGADVVVHRKRNHVALDPPLVDPVTGYLAKTPIGSVRNRLT